MVWLACYLIGSLPMGYWLARWLRGIDIRQHGSGNIGAANVYRVLGPGPALWVLALDALKGVVGVRLAAWAYGGSPYAPWAAVLGGLFAIVGHNWSLFLNFRGGKGVATSLGALIGLHPPTAALSFGVWLVALLLWRYASVASLLGGLSAPLWMGLWEQPLPYRCFALLGALFIVLRHLPNLKRLLQGTEPRIGPLPSRAEKGRNSP